jgi:hypothetical protein
MFDEAFEYGNGAEFEVVMGQTLKNSVQNSVISLLYFLKERPKLMR